jgi:hypothetical protein
MQQLEDKLQADKTESLNTFKSVRDSHQADQEKVQQQVSAIQNEARTDKNNLEKTDSDLAIVTLRLNQQQEELALS